MRCWLALAIAACGGPGDKPDAGPPDASQSTGSVTVIVTDRGEPVGGLPVIFQSADGARTGSAVTSPSGESGFDLVDGFVTVLLPRDRYGLDQLSTFAGVRDGDILHLDLAPRGPRTIALTVTVNADTVPGYFHIYSTCGGEQPFGTVAGEPITLALECTQPTLDLLAVRVDNDTHQPVATQFLGGISVDAKTVVFTGAYAALPTIAVTYTNPTGFAFVYTTQSIRTAQGVIFRAGFAGDPSAPAEIMQPVVAGARVLATTAGYPLATHFDEQVLFSVHDLGTSLDVSLVPRLPPYTSTGAFQAGKVVWTEATGNTEASLVRARVRVHRDDIPSGTAWTWQIVAPRGTASEITFPVLPVIGSFDFNPIATDIATVEELTNVRLSGADKAAAYNRARPNGFGDLNAFAPEDPNEVVIVQRRFVPEATQRLAPIRYR